MGTLPFAAGLAMVALARPSLGQDNALVRLGPYTLGLYALHFFFIDLLRPGHALFPGYLWAQLFPLLVYALSLATAIALATCPPLKRFVS